MDGFKAWVTYSKQEEEVKFEMRSDTQLVALLQEEEGEICPLCDDTSVMEVCTDMTFDGTPYGEKFRIPYYLYYSCDNPECNFEFVNGRQARHNAKYKVDNGWRKRRIRK